MQALIDQLQQTRAVSAERIIAFQESLTRDAAYALNWSDAVFQAAARIKVIDRVLDMLYRADPSTTISKLSATTTQIVTTLAVISMRSNTSTTSNLMEQYELAAYAEIVELLQE